MLDFAVKVSLHAYEVNDSDIEEMRQHGFSVEDIWIRLQTSQWGRRRVDSGFTCRPCKFGIYLGRCSPETFES